MDGILDRHILKKHDPLDEDAVRYELRTRGYIFEQRRDATMKEVICKGCGQVGLKGEAWKKVTAQKHQKIDWVHYSFYYCPACGLVGVHG